MTTKDGELRKAESSEEAIADKVSTFQRPELANSLGKTVKGVQQQGIYYT